jgi:tetratricopeptide (TPR) repeat protein
MSELNDPKLAVNSLNSIAILHQRMGEIERCRDCLQKSLELIEKSSLVGGDLELRQLNLLGNVCLKQADYTWSREYFMRQLWLSTELKAYLNEATALLNLGFLSTKIKTNTESSSSYYERCLLSLNTNFDTDHIRDVNLEQSVVELYAKCFIGLINSHLSQKDILNASLYAHSMLDFTLKQMQKPKSPKLDKYLKCMEINACSKLAVCYARQNRLSDAIKLHEREALLAQELNNILYLTRAYSHLGHLLHASKDYQGAISYYKLILAKIETNLVTSGGVPIRDERIIELIFFTLSNIGYCLDASGKYHEAKSMFEEQLEMARLLPGQKGVKSRAAALLNLVNLSINETSKIEYSQLMGYLKGLLLVYEELNDLNGQLFVTQCLAYSCHKEGDLNEAAQFYMKNIELATRLGIILFNSK